MGNINKIDIKSALIGAVATILLTAVCCLPFLIVTKAEQAYDRYEQGQHDMIERHKLENRGVL